MISVVIPAWNAERYLAEAIESVMAQSLPADEIVVVDDGSTDRTAEVCHRFDTVRYVKQDNSGPGAARNRGIREAQGDVIAFLDADDLWLPDKLERQHSVVESSDVDVVFGNVQNFISPDRAAQLVDVVVGAPQMVGVITSAALVRRHVFDRVGLFSVDRSVADWADWYARLTESGASVHHCPELLVRRRIHGDNLTMRTIDPRSYLRVVKESIDRRRVRETVTPGE